MNKIFFLLFLSLVVACQPSHGQKEDAPLAVPPKCQKLLDAYPDHLIGYKEGYLIWADNTTMPFEDSLGIKTFDQMLVQADLEDQMSQEYPLDAIIIKENFDPGRIRHEGFFRKMYGNTKEEVQQCLDTVYWLPSAENAPLLVSRVNGVADSLRKVSLALDSMPHLYRYLTKIGGTFNWRKIAGTNRLSAHSFGICIDINVGSSHYWRWAQKPYREGLSLSYHNDIPLEIVKVFERYGFIWGGKWYHYDTMHFEFRPELLIQLPPSQTLKLPKVTALEIGPNPEICPVDLDPGLGMR